MKKVKTGFWVLIVAFVAILIYQNQQFFLAGQSLRLNFLFGEYQSPEWKTVMICTGFFAAGLLLGIYILIWYHLRLKRKRKTLQIPTEKSVERVAAPEQKAKPDQALSRGADAETVVIPSEVTPPVAERHER